MATLRCMWPLFAGQTAIVEALLNAGADPDVVPTEASDSHRTLEFCAGMTPLHFAAHGGHAEIIDALLAAGESGLIVAGHVAVPAQVACSASAMIGRNRA